MKPASHLKSCLLSASILDLDSDIQHLENVLDRFQGAHWQSPPGEVVLEKHCLAFLAATSRRGTKATYTALQTTHSRSTQRSNSGDRAGPHRMKAWIFGRNPL